MSEDPTVYHVIAKTEQQAIEKQASTIMDDPTCSDWLAEALSILLRHDPQKAFEDVQCLHRWTTARYLAYLKDKPVQE